MQVGLGVLAHEKMFVQILSNIVSNAIKFVDAGKRPRVRMWAEQRDGHVRLWLEDNGIGIPTDQRGKVFELFERLHGIEAYPGSGVGLAIVKRGVERMGGQVGLESGRRGGCRFWIELPSAKSQNAPEAGGGG